MSSTFRNQEFMRSIYARKNN